LTANSVTAACNRTGVEYANWLFSTTKMHGSFITAAMFSDSWKLPSEVDPSPQ
jgi:hypothetical protein